jgi:hypothetical protein
MNSSEPLTQVAIESLRAIARAPATLRPETPRDPGARLELLNAILLRDEKTASPRNAQRGAMARGRTRL